MTVVTDEELSGRILQIVEQLRRALQDSALIALEIREYRRVLASTGARMQDPEVADQDLLTCRDVSLDRWPAYDEVCRVLRHHRELGERIAELRGQLRGLGIGPDLFE